MTVENSITTRRAGWHLWAVGVLGVLWNGFGCFDYIMTVTRNAAYLEPFPQDMLDHLFAMPWWMFAMWAIGVFGGLLGSIALLLKRAWAVKLFAVSLIAAVISNIVSLTDPGTPQMQGTELLPLLIIALAVAFLAYAYWQTRRGVLR